MLHDPETVDLLPGLVDLTVDHTEHVQLRLVDLPPGGRDAAVRAQMCPGHARPDGDVVAFADHLLDRDAQIRESAPQIGDEPPEPVGAFERLGARRRMQTKRRRDDRRWGVRVCVHERAAESGLRRHSDPADGVHNERSSSGPSAHKPTPGIAPY